MNRLSVFSRIMEDEWLDAIVLANIENVYYFCGFFNPVQNARPTELSTFYIQLRGETAPCLAFAGASIGLAARVSDTVRKIPFCAFPIQGCEKDLTRSDRDLLEAVKACVPDEVAAIRAALQDQPIRRVGVDFSRCSFIAAEAIRTACGDDTAFVDVQPHINRARFVKSAAEIESLRKAAHITEAALLSTIECIAEGVTEKEMRAVYESELIKRGAEPFFTIIGINGHGAYPNWTPSDTAAKRGDIIRFDIGCKCDGYCADMARIVSLGKPSRTVRTYYQAVKRGYEEALKLVRPGVCAQDLFQRAETVIRENGAPSFKRLHCGHFIGLNLYEGVQIAPDDDTVLEAGMVFCLETPYYHVGLGGFQMENMIAVTETGYDVLNEAPEELFVVDK